MTTEEAKEMTMEEKRKEIRGKMGLVDGVYLPSVPHAVRKPWPDKIDDLRKMTLRDDDIFLLTYPKSGTHWLWETINMLRQGRAEHAAHTKVQHMMEFVDVDVMDAQPSPRTLNTHLPFSMLPVPEMKRRRCKVVHVYRNPKDTCVSAYHMMLSSANMRLMVPCETFEEFCSFFFFDTKQLFGPYFRYLRQMKELQQGSPDLPCFNMSFEDTKKDPVGSVQRLAAFLELDVSAELCAEIAKECSFDSMKNREQHKFHARFHAESPLKPHGKDTPVIYRKGEVGDWKNFFTVAMSEKADQVIQREMADLSQSFPLIFQ